MILCIGEGVTRHKPLDALSLSKPASSYAIAQDLVWVTRINNNYLGLVDSSQYTFILWLT